MPKLKVCRLCLSPNNLLDVFYSSKSCAGMNHLRTCILLCTGINILFDDTITKYICKSCCDLSLQIFQFRKLALANEKALKTFEQIHRCINSNYPVDINQINELNNLLCKNSNIKVRITQTKDLKDDNITHANAQLINNNYAVHPSVSNILRMHGDIILPNEVLKENLNPTVVLDTSWECQSSDEESDYSSEEESGFGQSSEMSTVEINKNNSSDSESIDDIADEDYMPPRQRKRKKSLTTIKPSIKRPKQIVCEEDLSLSIQDIIKSPTVLHNSEQNIFTYNMFFHPNEYNFVKNIYESYLKQDNNHDNKSTCTSPVENIVVRKQNESFVSEGLPSQLSLFRIPVIYEYNCDDNFQVRIIHDRKTDALNSAIKESWSDCDVIVLNQNF